MAIELGLDEVVAGALLEGQRPGRLQPGPGAVFLGLYIFDWGVMFLLSYYFSRKSFFFRALMWVCEHASSPKGRKMAFFYFALACGLGVAAILRGLGVL